MATHSSVLAWKIPGMAEPGGLPSVGSHRVGHGWSDLDRYLNIILKFLRRKHSIKYLKENTDNLQRSSNKCDRRWSPWWLNSEEYLPMEETQVPSPIWEDPTCCEAAKLMRHNCWAYTLETINCSYWSQCALEFMLCNKRSHCNEKSAHCS